MRPAIYIPEAGERVRVQRWETPSSEVVGGERKLSIDVTGAVIGIERVGGGDVLVLDPATLTVAADQFAPRSGYADDLARHGLGYVFLGQDREHGGSWTLETEVTPLDSEQAEACRVRELRLAQLSRYQLASDTYEQLVTEAQQVAAKAAKLAAQRERARTELDLLRSEAASAEPVTEADPVCCQRYGRMHQAVFAVSGCRWYEFRPVTPDNAGCPVKCSGCTVRCTFLRRAQ